MNTSDVSIYKVKVAHDDPDVDVQSNSEEYDDFGLGEEGVRVLEEYLAQESSTSISNEKLVELLKIPTCRAPKCPRPPDCPKRLVIPLDVLTRLLKTSLQR